MAENQYDFPTEVLDLPSKGLLYSKDNPLSSGTIEIKYKLDYVLFAYKKDCVVIRESISSLSTYNSRAESYNFGSDLSKEQVSEQVIRDNINKFIYQINVKKDELRCLDES